MQSFFNTVYQTKNLLELDYVSLLEKSGYNPDELSHYFLTECDKKYRDKTHFYKETCKKIQLVVRSTNQELLFIHKDYDDHKTITIHLQSRFDEEYNFFIAHKVKVNKDKQIIDKRNYIKVVGQQEKMLELYNNNNEMLDIQIEKDMFSFFAESLRHPETEKTNHELLQLQYDLSVEYIEKLFNTIKRNFNVYKDRKNNINSIKKTS